MAELTVDEKLDLILEKIQELKGSMDSQESTLALLQAEALGSWRWDKRTGILRMFNTEGIQIAVFTVRDSPDESTRERRTDLEVVVPPTP